MIWLTSFSFVVLFFAYQHDLAEGEKYLDPSPGESHAPPTYFLLCLIERVNNSPVFTQYDEKDLEFFGESFLNYWLDYLKSGKRNHQTETAFSTYLAGVFVQEDAGNKENIAEKKEALVDYINYCSLMVTGTANKQFIAEFKRVIETFLETLE